MRKRKTFQFGAIDRSTFCMHLHAQGSKYRNSIFKQSLGNICKWQMANGLILFF